MRTLRLRVATAGASAVAGSVDFSFDGSRIARVSDGIGAQRIYPTEGRAESVGWWVDVVDASLTAVTGELSDASGRAVLLRRLCDLSTSDDGGGTWTVRATARIVDIQLNEDIGSYRLFFRDEREVERTSDIFTTQDTTQVYPPSIQVAYGDFIAGGYVSGVVTDVLGNLVRIVLVSEYGPVGSPVSPAYGTITGLPVPFPYRGKKLIDDDATTDLTVTADVSAGAATAGRYRTLRANVDGTDYEVWLAEFGGPLVNAPFAVDIIDTGASFTVNQNVEVVLLMDGHVPTEILPLHLPAVHLGQLWKDIYDGLYGDSTVRYDTAVFSAYDPATNPGGVVGHPSLPTVRLRITAPVNMATFIEEQICAPYGWAPLVNADGEVAPKRVLLPDASDVPDPGVLTTLSYANTSPPHVTWQHSTDEQVTVLQASYTSEKQVSVKRLNALGFGAGSGSELAGATVDDFALDLLETSEVTLETGTGADQVPAHDRVSDFGRHVQTVKMTGLHSVDEAIPYARRTATERYQRYGDGQVRSNVTGLSSLAGLGAGDYVLIDMAKYPNLDTGTRGGARLLQILSREPRVWSDEYAFELLDAGPNQSPLAAPSLSVGTPARYSLPVTIAGLPAGASYQLQKAASASEPAASSSLWKDARTGNADETVTLGGLNSGTTYWLRARSLAPGRITSDWSTAVSGTTDAITAPTGLSVTGATSVTADASWTNTETDLAVELLLDGTSYFILSAGTNSFKLVGLTASTTYNSPGLEVRYIDGKGGRGPSATATFSTTATAPTCSSPRGIAIAAGSSIGTGAA